MTDFRKAEKMVNISKQYRAWQVYTCPFCGSVPQVWALLEDGREMAAQVRCSSCGSTGALIDKPARRDPRTGEYNHDKPGALAITHWGRRVIPAMGRMQVLNQ